MSKESWDVLRKAAEIAELVEDWQLTTLVEGVSFVLSGTTKHAGFWGFSIARYDVEGGPAVNWTYEGTVATGELMLRLPSETAQRIFKHAEHRLKNPA
jgi:hypothetical protein